MGLRNGLLERTKRSLYYIGYRNIENSDSLFEGKENSYNYKIVKSKFGYWIADPILFSFGGNTYLFCEMYKTKKNKGCIGIAEYSERKKRFVNLHPIIEEPFHMSFPYVFDYAGRIFMIPEVGNTYQLRIYEMKDTAYKWKLTSVINTKGRISDIVSCCLKGELYLFCTEHCENDPLINKLVIMKVEWSPNISVEIIYETKGYFHNLRNGGPIICIDDEMYRVIQRDDEGQYGSGLLFARMHFDGKEYHEEILDRVVRCEDVSINVNRVINDIRGIHSYSKCNYLEVIDIYSEKMSFSGGFYHALNVFRSLFGLRQNQI